MKIWMKYLILISYIILLIIVGVLISIFGTYKCIRRDCVKQAKFILSNINSTVNPCDNFYKFVCGNYENVVSFRKGSEGVASVLDYIKYDINALLDDFLKKPMKVTDNRILKIVKRMYQPCTNLKIIQFQGVQPLWDAIYTSGGFPVVEGDDWHEECFSVGATDYKSRKSGFSGGHIFDCYVGQDKERPDRYAVLIKPPAFKRNLPGHEFVTETYSDKLYRNYLSYIVRLTFFLLNMPDYEQKKHKTIREKYEMELNETLIFKLELAKHIMAYGNEQDPVNLYNPMTLEHLQEQFPYVDWNDYFKHMLPPSATKLPKYIIVIGTSYFKGIEKLLRTTSKRTIENYIILENIFEGSLFLPRIYFSIYNKFRVNIQLRIAKRDLFCESIVKHILKGALSSLVVQTYHSTKGSQSIVTEITNKIQQHIRKSIDNLEWMDDKTKQNAILKLKKTKFILSLSDKQIDELQDVEARENYYEDLCLGRRANHMLKSYFCVNRFHFRKNWELLERTLTVFDEQIDVFTPQVTYDPIKNELLVPYGVLKYPAFSEMLPRYLNYGAIGSVIGSAMTRGYDEDGAEYNERGFKNNWWSTTTRSLYTKHCQCFENDYIEYAEKQSKMTVKSDKVLLKNVAEFEGINLAYQAYLDYLKKRYLMEQSLPGLEKFTPKQLFFIGFANIYCSYYKSKRLQNILSREIEIPYDFRVILSLQNLNEFSEAFGCKSGDQMNPHKKCKLLW